MGSRSRPPRLSNLFGPGRNRERGGYAPEEPPSVPSILRWPRIARLQCDPQEFDRFAPHVPRLVLLAQLHGVVPSNRTVRRFRDRLFVSIPHRPLSSLE